MNFLFSRRPICLHPIFPEHKTPLFPQCLSLPPGVRPPNLLPSSVSSPFSFSARLRIIYFLSMAKSTSQDMMAHEAPPDSRPCPNSFGVKSSGVHFFAFSSLVGFFTGYCIVGKHLSPLRSQSFPWRAISHFFVEFFLGATWGNSNNALIATPSLCFLLPTNCCRCYSIFFSPSTHFSIFLSKLPPVPPLPPSLPLPLRPPTDKDLPGRTPNRIHRLVLPSSQ